ncbi:MAG: DUF3179 domain-containing protein [Chloroflexi bacterium]|nr:DUF3179 domain-containing protein [Chloroflexota bacterium]
MQKDFAFFSIALIFLLPLACSSPLNSSESDNSEVYEQPNTVAETSAISGETDNSNSDSLDPAPTTAFDPAGRGGRGGGFVVLDNPTMIAAAQATWLDADEIVLGVEQNDEAQAFPISQMAYHHIANTTVGGEPYLVTY